MLLQRLGNSEASQSSRDDTKSLLVGGVLPSGADLPGGIAGSPAEDSGRAPPASGGGFSGREQDPAQLVTQMERDEVMARALAEEDGVLARQLQVQAY